MTDRDGPPILIGDEWQPRANPPDERSTEPAAPVSNDRRADDPDASYERAEPIPVGSDPAEQVATVSDETLPPEPGQESAPLSTHADQLDNILEELKVLRTETVHVNKILDRLHADNERLRKGESAQLVLPLFRDLVKMFDDWTTMAASWEDKESATPAEVARKCRDVAEDASLILERHGVDLLTPDVGTPFERRQHRAVAVLQAETAEADNTIAEVRRPGFAYGDKVIRFAEVVVARA